jgi:hypothetical protein
MDIRDGDIKYINKKNSGFFGFFFVKKSQKIEEFFKKEEDLDPVTSPCCRLTNHT